MKTTDFPHLHSLMLGGLQSNRILTDLVEIWGHQLTTLKLETVLTVIPHVKPVFPTEDYPVWTSMATGM